MSDVTISIKIPLKLVNEIEEIVDALGYQNRSELIRAAIRDYILAYQDRQIGLMPNSKSVEKNIGQP